MATTATKIALGVGCGILIAFGAMFATCAGCVAFVGKNMADTQLAKKAALAQVDFEDVKGERDGNYFIVTGKVRNKGEKAVSYVKVAAENLDKSGNVVDSNWTFAVASENLAPGDAKSFRIMIPYDKKAKNFRYFVKPD
jgi:hypothetical protein